MGTWIAGALVAAVAALAARSIIRDRKKAGPGACCGDCSRCHGHCG